MSTPRNESMIPVNSGLPVSPFETATSGAAARAQAEIQAAYAMAAHRPRDLERSRASLAQACGRAGFAKVATFSLPRRKWDPETRSHKVTRIRGLSVRAAEEVERALGNIRRSTVVTFEDDYKRLIEVTVVDLESNLVLSAPVAIAKTVERKKMFGGEQVLGERVNTDGQKVFIVATTDAELHMKQEALVSRIRRNLVLQLLPGDLRAEMEEAIEATVLREIAADPKAILKTIKDEFSGTGVTGGQLKAYLGHAIEEATVEELRDLLEIANSLRDGDTTWGEVAEARKGDGTGGVDAEAQERADLIGRAARAKIERGQAFGEALAANGLPADARLEDLAGPALRAVVSTIDAIVAKAAGASATDPALFAAAAKGKK